MPELFRAPLDATTRYCAVFGHPIKHSASPAMQNAGIAALGLNWRYLAFEVHPNTLRAAIEGARAMRFIGLNLTVPHKLLAMEMVDALDESARSLGAVNTIVFESRNARGEWVPLNQLPAEQITEVRSHGFNTDGDAVIRSLREEFSWPEGGLRGASVLLLGAGGAARATALRLAREGVTALYLANRTEEKVGRVALEIRGQYPGMRIQITLPVQVADGNPGARQQNFPGLVWQPHYPQDPVDLVINATSLGLKPDDPLPITEEWLRTAKPARVLDMIYRPAETGFLRTAKASGSRTANGIGMLLYQGARALELWSGQPAPVPIMREALLKNVYG